jgi:hypothetical protein
LAAIKKSKMIGIFLILALFSCEAVHNRSDEVPEVIIQEVRTSINLQVSSRVDTTINEVKEILSLYKDYINSKPDSIYNNPYWNNKEKAQYADFDFSRSSLYHGIDSDQLFRIYTPFVLSIEAKNKKYQIRVLYSNTATQPPYVGSKVWCIHKLNAVKEEGKWKLENLMVDKTEKWNKRHIGFIEYIFSNSHNFDVKQAEKALAFCNKIISRFNPTFKSKFRFYMVNGKDEMGELENFDYYFTGITTGKAREGMILSSKTDEFYPHEFIHKLLPVNEYRGHVVEEGLATFLGTKVNVDEYFSTMQELANDFKKRESYSLENILNNQVDWNGYPVAYPGGALICEVIYEKEGDEGIRKLALGRTNGYEEIINLSKDILQVNEDDVVRLIESKIKEFK